MKKDKTKKPHPTIAERAKKRFIELPFREGDPTELMAYLMARMSIARNAAKGLLAHRLVYVNNKIETKHDAPVRGGSTVKISREKDRKEFSSQLLDIVYEDNYILVVNKREGLLSISTVREKERTAHSILSEYVKRSNKLHHIFIVHRLDRETSGLMVFAKDEKTKKTLQDYWHEIVQDRRYMAIVGGTPDPAEGTIRSYLKDNQSYITYSSKENNGGDWSVTHYRTLKSKNGFSLMEMKLETGRKNQIRVHLQDIGHPIIGDIKYGDATSPIGRLALHAFRLHFFHPITGELMKFETPQPIAFKKIFNPRTEKKTEKVVEKDINKESE